MTKTQTIPWKPFGPKHKRYIKTALKNKMCVAEGAIRSGKTIDHCIVAAMHLETCPDRIHLASGSTIANAKLNIGVCNGFGLENLFRGRCRWGKYKDNEALFIQTQTGEKIVIFAGGAKADSYKRILGNSYGLWIATEINEHYDSTDSRTSFVKVAFGRQAAALQPFVLWDLNPCHPKNRIYTDYIDKYKKDFVGGYQYEHFTIADNRAISDERRAEIESQYDKDSVWYKRDILGLRVVAEGLIYRLFANDNSRYRITKKELADKRFITGNIGVDFGGNKSGHSFTFSGITKNYEELIVLKSERFFGDPDPKQLEARFVEFVRYVQGASPDVSIDAVYCDSAETVLIRGFRSALREADIDIPVKNAIKGEIIGRIRATTSLMAQERLFLLEGECDDLEEALNMAVWKERDDGEDERLDDGTTDVDSLDSFEYSFEKYSRLLGYYRR